ncbi:FHA domain-containing protein [Polymorphospora rubra]|nr:FHA domain-containing protein [Polymorphospora rubra]
MMSPDREHPLLDVTSTFDLRSFAEFRETRSRDSATGGIAASLPPGAALLAIHQGPNAGARFLLDTDLTTSGRHPDSDIFLDDVTVSRRHGEFHRNGDTFTVRDAGSLNGTYVNRERVESATLNDGDEVQIGKFRMTFIAAQRRPHHDA